MSLLAKRGRSLVSTHTALLPTGRRYHHDGRPVRVDRPGADHRFGDTCIHPRGSVIPDTTLTCYVRGCLRWSLTGRKAHLPMAYAFTMRGSTSRRTRRGRPFG